MNEKLLNVIKIYCGCNVCEFYNRNEFTCSNTIKCNGNYENWELSKEVIDNVSMENKQNLCMN